MESPWFCFTLLSVWPFMWSHDFDNFISWMILHRYSRSRCSRWSSHGRSLQRLQFLTHKSLTMFASMAELHLQCVPSQLLLAGAWEIFFTRTWSTWRRCGHGRRWRRWSLLVTPINWWRSLSRKCRCWWRPPPHAPNWWWRIGWRCWCWCQVPQVETLSYVNLMVKSLVEMSVLTMSMTSKFMAKPLAEMLLQVMSMKSKLAVTTTQKTFRRHLPWALWG